MIKVNELMIQIMDSDHSLTLSRNFPQDYKDLFMIYTAVKFK